MHASELLPARISDRHRHGEATSSRSDQTRTPVQVLLGPIHRESFDQDRLPASPVVHEQVRFVAVWLVHRCGAGSVESQKKGSQEGVRSPNALPSVALCGKGPGGRGATCGGWEMRDLAPFPVSLDTGRQFILYPHNLCMSPVSVCVNAGPDPSVSAGIQNKKRVASPFSQLQVSNFVSSFHPGFVSFCD